MLRVTTTTFQTRLSIEHCLNALPAIEVVGIFEPKLSSTRRHCRTLTAVTFDVLHTEVHHIYQPCFDLVRTHFSRGCFHHHDHGGRAHGRGGQRRVAWVGGMFSCGTLPSMRSAKPPGRCRRTFVVVGIQNPAQNYLAYTNQLTLLHTALDMGDHNVRGILESRCPGRNTLLEDTSSRTRYIDILREHNCALIRSCSAHVFREKLIT